MDGMSMEVMCMMPTVSLPGVAPAAGKNEFRAPLAKIAKFKGKSIGYRQYKGECAAGVQWALRQNGVMIGLTRTWRQGRQVRGNNISPGTAIASFRDGRYKNDHAAIFISQNEKGILVYDQYNHPKKPWSPRWLYFDRKKKNDYSNDGDFFYTITTAK